MKMAISHQRMVNLVPGSPVALDPRARTTCICATTPVSVCHGLCTPKSCKSSAPPVMSTPSIPMHATIMLSRESRRSLGSIHRNLYPLLDGVRKPSVESVSVYDRIPYRAAVETMASGDVLYSTPASETVLERVTNYPIWLYVVCGFQAIMYLHIRGACSDNRLYDPFDIVHA